MIERVRMTANHLAEPVDEPHLAPVPRPMRRTPVRLNRNFMNHPLARDRRAKLRWRRAGECWVAALPGNDRVRVTLPNDARIRRAPTALDMNVLFVIVAEAQRKGGTMSERQMRWEFREVHTIEFASMARLLCCLGMEVRDRHRAAVRDSLKFWSAAALEFLAWYDGRGRDGEALHVERRLPPPIRRVARRGNGLTITIDREWSELAAVRGYYGIISLPLPATAAAQNLALLIATSPTRLTEDGFELGFRRRLRSINRKIGVLHGARNQTLDRAVGEVEDWYRACGGEIVVRWSPDEDALNFCIVAKARTPRNKARKRGPTTGRGSKKRGPQPGRKGGHNPDAKGANNRTLL